MIVLSCTIVYPLLLSQFRNCCFPCPLLLSMLISLVEVVVPYDCLLFLSLVAVHVDLPDCLLFLSLDVVDRHCPMPLLLPNGVVIWSCNCPLLLHVVVVLCCCPLFPVNWCFQFKLSLSLVGGLSWYMCPLLMFLVVVPCCCPLLLSIDIVPVPC